jgi:23S rRNA (adenine1618-N6)-methyltransferase
MEDTSKRINMIMKELNVDWSWNDQENTGVCAATKNVWSRAARRKVQHQASLNKESTQNGHDTVPEPKVNLGVRITLIAPAEERVLRVRWLKGTDKVLFESFCGMLKRKLVMSDNPST